jgi:hypothetical protein
MDSAGLVLGTGLGLVAFRELLGLVDRAVSTVFRSSSEYCGWSLGYRCLFVFSLMDIGRQGRAVLAVAWFCSGPVWAGTANASSMAIIRMSLVGIQLRLWSFCWRIWVAVTGNGTDLNMSNSVVCPKAMSPLRARSELQRKGARGRVN